MSNNESNSGSTLRRQSSAGVPSSRRSGASWRAVNLNTASEEELQLIAVIDGVQARRIVEYRNDHGPFSSWRELEKVDGLDGRTIAVVRRSGTL